MDDIVFQEKPFDKIKFVDLINESDEMKWKILVYQNQKFVLDSIVDSTIFTREGHEKFLNSLDNLNRKHFIAYFEGRAIGKMSYTPDGNSVSSVGYYLFNLEDTMSGLGLLMVSSIFMYLFEVKKFDIVYGSAKKTNKNSNSIAKKYGCRVYKKDDKCNYYVCERNDYLSKCTKFKENLRVFFT